MDALQVVATLALLWVPNVPIHLLTRKDGLPPSEPDCFTASLPKVVGVHMSPYSQKSDGTGRRVYVWSI